MEDQVRLLNDIGIPVIAITGEEDEEFTQQVLNSNFVLVYGSLQKDVNRSRFRRGSLYYIMVCSYNLQPVDQAEN